MADVFISYSSKDRQHAATLARSLGDRGWSVWWDREIVTGEAFDRAIERALEEACCVVVLWSKDAVESEWVKNEAAAAAERGVLLPANLDGVRLPLEFRRRQTANLSAWAGDARHAGYLALCRGIEGVLQGESGEPAAPRPGPSPTPAHTPAPMPGPSRRTSWMVGAMLIVMAVVAGVAYSLRGGPADPSASPGSNHPPVIAEATTGTVEEAGSASSPPAMSTSTQAEAPPVAGTNDDVDIAATIAGLYVGEVISDSKGSSRSNVTVRVDRVGAHTVHVSSTYARIAAMNIALTQVDKQVLADGGDTPFIVDLSTEPPTLSYNPHNELAYSGRLKSR